MSSMATEKEATGALEWRVTVPNCTTVKLESTSGPIARVWFMLLDQLVLVKSKISKIAKNIGKIGADDPRKVVHCMKVGLALTLVSIFYYLAPLNEGVGGNAMWAIMTVVVIFEFTVGGCFYKGLNRGMATMSAGTLAIGTHWIAHKSGETMEPILIGFSVFLLASAATFSRFIPTVKARFDYGITIFILTFSFIAVSGYRVDKLLDLARHRLVTISIGIFICLIVCVLACPVWAGEDLHRLVVRNIEKLACSLEVCVAEYFKECNEKEAASQQAQGYKCVLNSKATEESLANLAKWEPAHGLFGFRHPWSQYLKVGTTMRHCAYYLEALNGCKNSETQAPDVLKKHVGDVCLRFASKSSEVLKESARSINLMRKSQSMDILVGEMNKAVEELHIALRTLPKQSMPTQTSSPREANAEKKQTNSAPVCVPLIEVMPLVTFALLLIEISLRIKGVVDAVTTLQRLACFKPVPADNNC